MLELYHWEPNANSGKPIMALKEKGVDFVSRYTDMLNFDQHKPEYLKINPAGTIPTMVHDGLVFAESSQMGEYVDATFAGPPLRPDNPLERWRMRWWTKFFDTFFGPSLSMIGWSIFVGPMVRQKDPEELRKAIERMPLKERREAWSTAIYNKFTEEQMAESRRRVEFGIRVFEESIRARPYVAGPTFSLGDINVFCMAYALPVMQPENVNKEKTPGIVAWLRRIYARPAILDSFKLGRTPMAQRAADVVNLLGG